MKISQQICGRNIKVDLGEHLDLALKYVALFILNYT